MGRVEDKINEVNQFVNDLEEVLPSSFEEYSNSLEKSCKIPVYKVSRELLLLVV
jgi:hypothetical protein